MDFSNVGVSAHPPLARPFFCLLWPSSSVTYVPLNQAKLLTYVTKLYLFKYF
jgi:hypothetical protein